MVSLRSLVILGLSFHIAAAAPPPTDSPAATPSTVKESNPSADKPAFPLIVRIDDEALLSLREKSIRHQAPVDRVILGTRAVGTSWTTGSIDVQMNPDREDASFNLRFRGTTQTKTTGYNGPAIIYSHTYTDFACARQVIFEPRVGLLAGRTVSNARTRLVYDGFDADRQLGRRLISRIAERRANEQFSAAQAIAQRDNQSEVCESFDRRLDAQIVAINRQLNIARYVNALFGPMSKPHLASCSTQDCILIGMGNEKSPRRLVTLPPERKDPAPIEIWIHSSLFGERVANLAAIVEKIEDRGLPTATQLQVMQLMFGAGQPPENQLDVGFQQGWVVIGLQNDAPNPTAAALIMVIGLAPKVPEGVPETSPVAVSTSANSDNKSQVVSGGR